MAEVVGVVVVGVVSFGVQFAESVQKIKRFYNTVKHAPDRLAEVIEELDSLSDILTDMEDSYISEDTETDPKIQRCVNSCRKSVERFSTYVNGLESRIKRCKRRGILAVALKSEDVEQMISRLESSKSNLSLAYMLWREAMADKRATYLQKQMETLAGGQTILIQQGSSMQITELTPTNNHPKRRSAHHGRVALHLSTPKWLSQTIREIAVIRAISGWTISLRSYSIVPRDSPVHKACKNGNVDLLHRLFESGAASPFDKILEIDGSMQSLVNVRPGARSENYSDD